jgi:phospholipase/carboxylesterase
MSGASPDAGRVVEQRGVRAAVWEASSPSIVVALCHGYAAPGDDLHDLRRTLVTLEPALARQVTWILPEGPEVAEANPWFGRAWWQIDMDVVRRAVVEHEHDGLIAALEAGLDDASKQMASFLDSLLPSLDTGRGRLVLGGFSQGSMLMADVALTSSRPVSALALLSTTLLNADAWRAGTARRRGVPALIAHGERDPLLPVEGARALADLLAEEGLAVERAFFSGSHKMPVKVHQAMAALLRSQVEAP